MRAVVVHPEGDHLPRDRPRNEQVAEDGNHAAHSTDRGAGLELVVFRDLPQRLLEAARVLFNITQGARIPWANGLVGAQACKRSIEAGVDLLFCGLRDSDTAGGA